MIDLCRDHPDVIEPLKFLRQREIVHFQRFGEALRSVQDKLAQKKFYMNSDSPMFVNNNQDMGNNTQNNMQNYSNMGNMNNGCGCGR